MTDNLASYFRRMRDDRRSRIKQGGTRDQMQDWQADLTHYERLLAHTGATQLKGTDHETTQPK